MEILRTPLNKRACKRSVQLPFNKAKMIVAQYKVNDNGLTECVPTPENMVRRAHDGRTYEIANLMYGALPEQLVQLPEFDPQIQAEKITSAAVRRFGDLDKQRAALIAKYKNNENV